MLYLDTSLVVTLVAAEPVTAQAQAWLAAQQPGDAAISDWVLTEAMSALSIKQRAESLDALTRARAERNLRSLAADAFVVLPVSRQAFRLAGDMASQVELGLRASDALHLAVAAEHGASLVTRDMTQARAAGSLGIATELVEVGGAQ